MRGMGKKTILWGGKSQARIVEAELKRIGRKVDYVFDAKLGRPEFETDADFFNDATALKKALSDCGAFLVCIGGAHGAQRAGLSTILRDRYGLEPLSVVSPQASVDPDAELGAGVQIMPGACIGLGAQIGAFSLINTNATVDHECVLGTGVHVMGAAAVAGRVRIGDHASIGTNATVLPDARIGAGAQVGAAALIRHDVPPNAVVVGVPARVLRHEEPQVDFSALE